MLFIITPILIMESNRCIIVCQVIDFKNCACFLNLATNNDIIIMKMSEQFTQIFYPLRQHSEDTYLYARVMLCPVIVV